jgi:hypothetical protein
LRHLTKPWLLCLRPPARRPLYTTAQVSIGGFGGGGSFGTGEGATGQRRADTTYISDELNIPYSAGMLDSFSPYRSSSLPRELTCFECQALHITVEEIVGPAPAPVRRPIPRTGWGRGR